MRVAILLLGSVYSAVLDIENDYFELIILIENFDCPNKKGEFEKLKVRLNRSKEIEGFGNESYTRMERGCSKLNNK